MAAGRTDHRHLALALLVQQVIEQRRLSRAEEARQHGDRQPAVMVMEFELLQTTSFSLKLTTTRMESLFKLEPRRCGA